MLQGPVVVVQPVKPDVLPKLEARTVVVHDRNIALPNTFSGKGLEARAN